MSHQKDTVLDFQEDMAHTASDQLQFQDISHTELDNSEEPPGAKVQTHTFTNFPNHEDSDDESQANLLKGEKKQPSFWTFDYYQSYFDVDTHHVLRRILGSVLPNPKSNYLQDHIRPNPDLYGPFWICMTLVFTTAIAGNMANYFQLSGKDYKWQYDFHKVTFAATAIFGYWWLMPTFLYGLLWWRGSQAGYLFSEILCVYGYSLAIYIPISILWVIQISWLQWLLVMIGMALSGSVLVITFWPAVGQDNKRIAMVTTGLIIVFHGLLAIGFVLYFFHVPAADTMGGPVPAANITAGAAGIIKPDNTTPANIPAGNMVLNKLPSLDSSSLNTELSKPLDPPLKQSDSGPTPDTLRKDVGQQIPGKDGHVQLKDGSIPAKSDSPGGTSSPAKKDSPGGTISQSSADQSSLAKEGNQLDKTLPQSASDTEQKKSLAPFSGSIDNAGAES